MLSKIMFSSNFFDIIFSATLREKSYSKEVSVSRAQVSGLYFNSNGKLLFDLTENVQNVLFKRKKQNKNIMFKVNKLKLKNSISRLSYI